MEPCHSCGSTNAEDARFCSACGTRLDQPSAVAVRKIVTLLFTDVSGSTAMGEGRDPEAIRTVMDRYFAAMREVIERHGGTVEKFVGDAVMAAFGIPVVREDDALRAVRAAAEMRDRLAELNEGLQREWSIRIAIRTGVNTGEVVAGDSITRETFATGDAVNTTARLEQAAGAGEILLGESTYRLVRHAVDVEPVEPLTVKGKAAPVPAFRVLGVRRASTTRSAQATGRLVGRDAELDAVRVAMQAAADRYRCGSVLITGSPGVGKSRLVDEVMAAPGLRTFRGGCLSYGEGITFWPIAQILRQAAGIHEDDQAETIRSKVHAVAGSVADPPPDLEDRLNDLLGLGASSGGIDRTFLAVRTLVMQLVASGPLVLVIEDLHWAEPALLQLIDHLVDRVDAPVCLVLTARPELSAPGVSFVENGPGRVVIRLEPLEGNDAAGLIRSRIGTLPDRLTDVIVEASGGNPLFVEELVAMFLEQGVIRESGDGWEVVGDIDRIVAPPTISALIGARLDVLPRVERTVAERASVIGVAFERKQVRGIAELGSDRELEAALSGLAGRELIRARDVDDGHEFHHGLIRDQAYVSIPKLLRADLHERFATWLEARERDGIVELDEIVGHHLSVAHALLLELRPAGDRERELARRGGERYASAGRRAWARGDVGSASTLLGRAAVLLDRGHPLRFEVLRLLGAAQRDAGRPELAVETLDEAIAIAEARGDEAAAWRATAERFDAQQRGSDADRQAAGTVETTLTRIPALEAAGDHFGLAKAWRLLTMVAWDNLRFAESERLCELGVEEARLAGDPVEEVEIAAGLAVSDVYGPKPTSEAIRHLNELLETLGGNTRAVAFILGFLPFLEAMRGRFDDAYRTLRRAARAVEEAGVGRWRGASPETEGFVAFLAGDLDRARRVLEPHVGGGSEDDFEILSVYCAVLSATGRADESLRIVGDAPPDSTNWGRVLILSAAAEAERQLGRLDEARASAELALGILAGSDETIRAPAVRVTLGLTRVELGERERGIDDLRAAESIYRAKENLVMQARTKELIAGVR